MFRIRKLRFGVLALILASLPTLTGCGSGSAPAAGEYVEVSGNVVLPDGKPMKAGAISFEPEVPGGRPEMTAVTDGAFKLSMFAGKYRVALDAEAKKPSVPGKYTKTATSDLIADVKSGTTPLQYTLKK